MSEIDVHKLMTDFPLSPIGGEDNTYGCDICGRRFDWDDGITWVSSEVGVCHECYEKFATDKHCPRCGNTIFVEIEPDIDYPYLCLDCDENFYDFEVD